MIIFGKRYFGKCYNVPGVFHVETLFYHIDFIPLCSYGSYLFIHRVNQPTLVYEIPMNSRSHNKAYLCGLSLFIAILFLAIAASFAQENDEFVMVPITVSCLSILMLCAFHGSMTDATYESATDLCSSLPDKNLGRILQCKVEHFFNTPTSKALTILVNRKKRVIPKNLSEEVAVASETEMKKLNLSEEVAVASETEMKKLNLSEEVDAASESEMKKLNLPEENLEIV